MNAAIKIQGLSKSFGPTQVLKNIDLEVAPQTVTCLIGPSGSGKSTLLRCIAFLEEASEGLIQIEGEYLGFAPEGSKRTRLPAPKIRAVRSRIGMVFQQFNLWPHMSHRADHYPSQLSGGQQQRVAIARALALEPKIMLFDEATSSLDPELTGEVLKVMRDLAASGMTMVVVTHEIGFAASVGSRIVFLDHGELLLQGTPQEVFAKPRHARLDQFLDTYLDRGAASLL
jgi:polar amino acid transport system ATP-binding protein